MARAHQATAGRCFVRRASWVSRSSSHAVHCSGSDRPLAAMSSRTAANWSAFAPGAGRVGADRLGGCGLQLPPGRLGRGRLFAHRPPHANGRRTTTASPGRYARDLLAQGKAADAEGSRPGRTCSRGTAGDRRGTGSGFSVRAVATDLVQLRDWSGVRGQLRRGIRQGIPAEVTSRDPLLCSAASATGTPAGDHALVGAGMDTRVVAPRVERVLIPANRISALHTLPFHVGSACGFRVCSARVWRSGASVIVIDLVGPACAVVEALRRPHQ